MLLKKKKKQAANIDNKGERKEEGIDRLVYYIDGKEGILITILIYM